VTIAIRPSEEWDSGGYRSDLGKDRTGIFLRKGLDTGIAEEPVRANQGSGLAKKLGRCDASRRIITTVAPHERSERAYQRKTENPDSASLIRASLATLARPCGGIHSAPSGQETIHPEVRPFSVHLSPPDSHSLSLLSK
jgi:hypothetical protein